MGNPVGGFRDPNQFTMPEGKNNNGIEVEVLATIPTRSRVQVILRSLLPGRSLSHLLLCSPRRVHCCLQIRNCVFRLRVESLLQKQVEGLGVLPNSECHRCTNYPQQPVTQPECSTHAGLCSAKAPSMSPKLNIERTRKDST